MDKKSKIITIIFSLLIVGAIVITFYRIVFLHDYIISIQVDCNPKKEQCFIWKCDPNSSVEGEACTGQVDLDIWFYKIKERSAKNIPDCDPNSKGCKPFACEQNEKGCREILCSLDVVSNIEECSNPKEFKNL